MTEAMVDDALATEADRDAAGNLMRSLGEPEHHISRFFDGELDHTDVVQAFKAHRLAGVAAGREEACQAIEQRIHEGYDVPARKVDQCAHGKFGWEDCIACYDDALEGTLSAIRQRGE